MGAPWGGGAGEVGVGCGVRRRGREVLTRRRSGSDLGRRRRNPPRATARRSTSVLDLAGRACLGRGAPRPRGTSEFAKPGAWSRVCPPTCEFDSPMPSFFPKWGPRLAVSGRDQPSGRACGTNQRPLFAIRPRRPGSRRARLWKLSGHSMQRLDKSGAWRDLCPLSCESRVGSAMWSTARTVGESGAFERRRGMGESHGQTSVSPSSASREAL